MTQRKPRRIPKDFLNIVAADCNVSKKKLGQLANKYYEDLKTSSGAKRSSVKRPLSNYMLYSKAKRPSIIRKHPDAKQTEIAKLLGEAWHKETDAVKAKYTKESEARKASYKNRTAVPKKASKKASKSVKRSSKSKASSKSTKPAAATKRSSKPAATKRSSKPKASSKSTKRASKSAAGKRTVAKK